MKALLNTLCLTLMVMVSLNALSGRTAHPATANSPMLHNEQTTLTAKQLSHVQENLVGEWANSHYPFEVARNGNKHMAGAFLYYRFNADGTYSKSLGNSEAQIDETGNWEISADGRYLMMHTEAYQGGKKVKQTMMARIKFVMYDEMVLEFSLQVNDESFCTKKKDFYFSKV